jgi:hypothetical protein
MLATGFGSKLGSLMWTRLYVSPSFKMVAITCSVQSIGKMTLGKEALKFSEEYRTDTANTFPWLNPNLTIWQQNPKSVVPKFNIAWDLSPLIHTSHS